MSDAFGGAAAEAEVARQLAGACGHCGLRLPELGDAEVLAQAAERMIEAGLLDSRSPVGDALLDYRDGQREMGKAPRMKFFCRWHGDPITAAEPYWASAPDSEPDKFQGSLQRAAETFASRNWPDAVDGAERTVCLGRTLEECNEAKITVVIQVGTVPTFDAVRGSTKVKPE